MENDKFYEEISKLLDIPFDVEDVENIEENCGTLWIQLYNGSTYYLQIQKCENEDS